jgi:hypothetical protein
VVDAAFTTDYVVYANEVSLLLDVS